MRNPLNHPTADGPLISLDQIDLVGANLVRPECVLCDGFGHVHVTNGSGGVTTLFEDGTQRDLMATDPPVPLMPNGIAKLPGGAFLLANLADAGGVWRLEPDGTVSPYLVELDGAALPPANFVLCDTPHSAWITVSTRRSPRAGAYRSDIADGFIVRVTPDGAWIAADELGYTNECQVHPKGDWLYVNETFARRLSRFPILSGSALGPRETVIQFGEGVFPDGLCFDEEGAAWVTSIVSNRIIRVLPDGEAQLILEDMNTDHVAAVEAAYLEGTMDRVHLDRVVSRCLKNTSSLAFAGRDRKTIYVGCLLDSRIYRFPSPIAGVRPHHWSWS
ncbi:MAG: SMP-30/gluconolactonase/LRE family protein [Pseudomonadota bacterium]